MLLAMLLHAIQHLFFGYSVPHIISQESFLQGAAAPARRAGVLVAALSLWPPAGQYCPGISSR
ncbi:hypothetical protein [Candidatus Sodalis endolongispinus]|uniref:hypothetical protein n=1 Tax=Candidatus Sodalis endolongispinus TaxID=2812662 RepID=UPI0028A8C92C|nr:hypothetical protein [Candidatus Sodalis endolongispinus]